MRRKEKEITNLTEVDSILKDAQVCRIALARDNEPYLVPVFFGYDGKRLYFHTAKKGKKIDFLAFNSRVCFEVERNVSVISDPYEACKWSGVFESVIGYGDAIELTTLEEKEYGLNQIMMHYSGKNWRYEQKTLKKTKVWCVEIESMTGKRSKTETA
jgi:nitroimidazol reductase NimA-like FMN-containing flavoprotein (pyridoxamine 5'-phosphate oxidase superfamily)